MPRLRRNLVISKECAENCQELLKRADKREDWINRLYYANIAKNVEEIKNILDEIAKEYWKTEHN